MDLLSMSILNSIRQLTELSSFPRLPLSDWGFYRTRVQKSLPLEVNQGHGSTGSIPPFLG